MVSNTLGKLVIALLKSLGTLFFLFPRSFQLFLGVSLGRLLALTHFRFSVIQHNLAIAFPNDAQKRNLLAKKIYEHLGHLLLEILMLFGPMRKFVFQYVDVTGIEHVHEAKKQGKGLIFLSSHVGNWEVMAAAGGAIVKSNLMLVTKRLRPEFFHSAIQKRRHQCEVQATYEPKTLRDVVRHLKKNGAVGFVLDQYAGPPVGVRVPLFGVPVGTTLAVATIVKRTGTVVLPVENFRHSKGRWSLNIGAPLQWINHPHLQHELAINTASYTSLIEKSILAHPEQWLWTHRRFKGDLSPLREDEWSEGRLRR